MKVKASELKKGDKIKIAGKEAIIESVEISDIGKQGKKKCRIAIKLHNGEKMAIVRPEDYPMEIL